jgi:hypothetical protein
VATFGSPGALDWLRAHGDQTDSVELKALLTPPAETIAEALTGRAAPTWSTRRMYLLDTSALELVGVGVEIRLRRRARGRYDLAVSTRRNGGRARATTPPAARVEFDVVPGALWQDVEVRREIEARTAAGVVDGLVEPRELLSSAQRAWARVGGRDVLDDAALKALQVHGPLIVHRVKVTAPGLGLGRADLEHFRYPGGQERVELSTRCTPSDVTSTASAFEQLLAVHAITPAPTYRTKTSMWLDDAVTSGEVPPPRPADP